MRLAKNDVPVKFSAPGAVARQQLDFGDATG
nr:cupin domain-containing protein [Candidatus Krumholzibacteria bacterium]